MNWRSLMGAVERPETYSKSSKSNASSSFGDFEDENAEVAHDAAVVDGGFGDIGYEIGGVISETAEIARIARLDQERAEADRIAKRGYDCDCSALGHVEFMIRTGREDCGCLERLREAEIDRLAEADGWQKDTSDDRKIEEEEF